MKKFKVIRVVLDGEVFMSAILLACAWGKLSWGWFWAVFVLNAFNVYYWSTNSDEDET